MIKRNLGLLLIGLFLVTSPARADQWSRRIGPAMFAGESGTAGEPFVVLDPPDEADRSARIRWRNYDTRLPPLVRLHGTVYVRRH
jgi:hypothetical protein